MTNQNEDNAIINFIDLSARLRYTCGLEDAGQSHTSFETRGPVSSRVFTVPHLPLNLFQLIVLNAAYSCLGGGPAASRLNF